MEHRTISGTPVKLNVEHEIRAEWLIIGIVWPIISGGTSGCLENKRVHKNPLGKIWYKESVSTQLRRSCVCKFLYLNINYIIFYHSAFDGFFGLEVHFLLTRIGFIIICHCPNLPNVDIAINCANHRVVPMKWRKGRISRRECGMEGLVEWMGTPSHSLHQPFHSTFLPPTSPSLPLFRPTAHPLSSSAPFPPIQNCCLSVLCRVHDSIWELWLLVISYSYHVKSIT